MKKLIFILAIFAQISCVQSKNESSEVRGVWVPDPQYTNVLKSYQNVVDFVSMLDTMNFNSIFIVSYALNKTIYPSEVLFNNGIYTTIDSTNMLSPFTKTYNHPLKSNTNDPVADLISEAHKRKIKVFFWYEFGFMADIKLATSENNPLLAKNPSWIGIGNDGKPANYNEHDYYFNAFDPYVQQYILDLITEGITRYPNVDGIQGDDRLPAMCINSGYDPKTIAQYKADHQGVAPPTDFKDSTWVNYRLNILNDFGKRLYSTVKALHPDMLVSFAPNPYPWCKDNLMQEWPKWVNMGICDLLAVQSYRSDSISYRNTVLAAQSFIKPAENKQTLFSPGVLMMVSGKISDAEIVKKQLQVNRELKTNGEIFFYNEGLNNPDIKRVIKEIYTKKVDFPSLEK